jgi:hypothetical protein
MPLAPEGKYPPLHGSIAVESGAQTVYATARPSGDIEIGMYIGNDGWASAASIGSASTCCALARPARIVRLHAARPPARTRAVGTRSERCIG